MQRLFSTFANGWPGLGLFIQRLALGMALIHNGVMQPSPLKAGWALSAIVEALLGVLLMLGLWTPIAGVLVVVTESLIAFSIASDSVLPIMLAVLGGSLAMIGPGAWSVDARLFGRKHIEA